MEKMKWLLVVGFWLFLTSLFAQEETIIDKGLIRAQATISPSKMLGFNESRFYLHGNLEGYVSKKVSVTGEAYFDLGSLTEGQNSFDFNHKLFFGANYHFTRGNSDFYVGLQPGFAITKLNIPTILTIGQNAKTGVNPIFSLPLGYNYYINHFFHFFLQTRLILGQHNYNYAVNLNEFNFSAGLGFNINSTKK